MRRIEEQSSRRRRRDGEWKVAVQGGGGQRGEEWGRSSEAEAGARLAKVARCNEMRVHQLQERVSL